MTPDVRWKQRFDNFQRALHQLTLAMDLKAQRPLSDLEQQGLIQGFEFTHELAWNVLKDYLSSYTYNQTVAHTLGAAIAERYYPAFCALQQRFAKEA
jgi:hypothetical protein